MPDKLQLLPAERAPTSRKADDLTPEGVLSVEGLKEMGELVSALTERAEIEKREREALYATDGMDAPMDGGGGGALGMAASYPPAGGGGAAGGPEAPPEMDDEDDD